MAPTEYSELQLLGPLSAHPGNAPLHRLRTRKARALALYLLIESIGRPGRRFQRARLGALLWEGMPAASALENLRQTLYQIRKGWPGAPWLDADRTTVSVVAEAPAATDVARFLHLARTQPEAAPALYRGALAADFSLPDSRAFEAWLEERRRFLQDRLLHTLEGLADHHYAQRDHAGAARYARQYLQWDPFNEAIYRLLMRALAEAGQRSAALRTYREYEVLLKETLAAAPAAALRQLADRIRRSEAPLPPDGPAAAESKQLLVLPFDDLDRDGERPSFAAGIFEDLLTQLARVERLSVISRTTALRYKAAARSTREIHEELGVDYVLEGSVRRAGDRVKVAAQLIELPRDRHLWARAFERTVEEVFALQEEIAWQIARQLELRLFEAPGGAQRINRAAYELLLKGQTAYFQGNNEGLERAARYLREAVALAPDFAKAHLKLATTYSSMASWWGARRAAEVAELYNAAIERSKADPSLAGERHTVEGWMHLWRWELETAEYHFRRAVALHTNAEWLPAGLAHLLNVTGRSPEALRVAEKGLETNPLLVQNHIVAAEASLLLGDYRAALDKVQLGLSLAPDYQPGLTVLGWLHLLRAEPERAIEQLGNRAPETLSYFVLGRLGQAYAAAGRTAEATAVLDRLRRCHERGEKGAPYFIALILQSLSDPAAALDWLEEGLQYRDTDYLWLAVQPEWAPLRDHPRFRALLRAVGLEAVV